MVMITLYALLFYDFFLLGDDRDVERVKFVHRRQLESTSSGPHL